MIKGNFIKNMSTDKIQILNSTENNIWPFELTTFVQYCTRKITKQRGTKIVFGTTKKVKGIGDASRGNKYQMAGTQISHAYFYISENHIYILSRQRIYDKYGKGKGNNNRRFRVNLSKLKDSFVFILLNMLVDNSDMMPNVRIYYVIDKKGNRDICRIKFYDNIDNHVSKKISSKI